MPQEEVITRRPQKECSAGCMRIPECATLQHKNGVINDAGLIGYPFRKRSKVGSLPAKEWREMTECEVVHAACVTDKRSVKGLARLCWTPEWHPSGS